LHTKLTLHQLYAGITKINNLNIRVNGNVSVHVVAIEQGMSEPVVMEEQVPGSDTNQVQGKIIFIFNH
jgi:hypothetical protein